MARPPNKVLVVGSGAIGLRTAVELLRRKVPVVLRSPYSPLDPRTCSMGAGGFWMPYHCDDNRTDRWALETLDELLRLEAASEDNHPVERIPALLLKRQHEGPTVEDFTAHNYQKGIGGESRLPTWTTDPRLNFQHMSLEMLDWQNSVHKLRIPSFETLKSAGYDYAWLFRSVVVDCPKMLKNLLQEIVQNPLTQDVNVETGRKYEDLGEMVDDARRLGCDTVVNCTGLGSSSLCKDRNLQGARGAILHYNRSCSRRDENGEDVIITTDEPPWGSETEPAYLIPRGNILVVGGTYLVGDSEHTIRPDETRRLTKNAESFGIDTENATPIGSWVGFRPYRPMVRLEVDDTGGRDFQVVHNYGHGGSGWTVNVGAAGEVASLLLGN